MPRSPQLARRSWSPAEGGQGREAPKGSLDGPGYSTHSLIAAVVGPDGPDGPQVNLGKEVGHGPRNTVPSNTRGVTVMHGADHFEAGHPVLLASDLSDAFEALIALSDARWDLCAMSADDPGREECWSVMVIESGKLLQAAFWTASGLLGEGRPRATFQDPRGGSDR